MIRKNFFISLIVALILLTGIDTWAAPPSFTHVSTTSTSGTIVITFSAVDNAFGAIEHGIVINTSAAPTKAANVGIVTFATAITDGAEFSATFTGLTANTQYYVRAFAYDGVTDEYSTEFEPTTAPATTTNAASSVTAGNASLNGQVTQGTSIVYTDRGFVYSLTGTNSDPLVLGTGVTKTQVAGTNDFATYTLATTDLVAATGYSYKSYVTKDGINFYYGAVETFTTSAAAVPVLAATTAVNTITAQTASSGYDVTDAGGVAITQSGIVWDVNTTPTTALSTKTTQGVVTAAAAAATSNLTGLLGNTMYYVRAYATNSVGTAYGTQATFTTEGPDVTSSAASSVTGGNATLNGTVVGDGAAAITARGFVYSLTATNANPLLAGTGVTNIVEGLTAVSAFTSVVTDLVAATGYSYRSYATTSEGTSYGAVQTFTTSAAAVPVLAATTVVNTITATTASSGYDVTDAGGVAITQSGIVWSTLTNPTVALTTKTTQGVVTAAAVAATSNLTGLLSGTLYYVRSYATNSVGTSYGSQTTFSTTSAAPSIQSKLISWQNLTTTTVNLKWVKGNGAQRIVVIKPATAIGVNPADASDYTADASFGGAGSAIDGTGKVVYEGTGTSVNVTGLTAGTIYYVKVYEFNGSGVSTLYAIADNTNNPRNFTTVSNAPAVPTSLAVTAIDSVSFDVSWVAADYTSLAKNSAFSVFTGECAWYNRTDIGLTTAFTFDGLSTNSNYFWQMATYNNSGTSSYVNYTDATTPTAFTDGRIAPLANEAYNTSLALTASIPVQETTNNTQMYLVWSGGTTGLNSGTMTYIIVAQPSSAGSIDSDVPVDGTVYTGNTVYSTGTAIGSSFVVYEGTGTSATITGLTANTEYKFRVYVYQTNNYRNNGNFSDRNYNVSGITATRNSIAAEQTASPTLPVFSALGATGTGYTLSWTAAAAVNNLHYVVVAKAGSAPTSLPVDGTYPANNAGVLGAAGANTVLANGEIIYTGTGTSIALTGLTAATDYYFAIYAANVGSNGTTTVNYRTGSPLTTNRFTLKAENVTAPTVAITNAVSETGAVNDKAINVAFTKGASVDSVIVVIRQAGVPVSPVDGTNYPNPTSGVVIVGNNVTVSTTAGVPTGATTTGTGSYVVYAGIANATNIQIGGLIPNTAYQVLVAQYQRSVNTTENYSNESILTIFSISTTPTAQVTGLNASAFTTNTITAAWTDAADPGTLVSIKAGAGITNHPVDGTNYTPNLDFVSGSDLGNSTFVKNYSAGASPIVITGLSPSTLYTINAYSYKDDAQQASVQKNYRITSPQSIQRVTLAAPQVTGATALSFTNVTSSGMSLVVGGATTVTSTKYLVVATAGGTPNSVDPTSGLGNYAGTANSTTPVNFSTLSQLYSPAGVDQSGSVVLYDGVAATIAITNLTAKTQYSYSVWAYNTAAAAVTGATESNNDKAFFATETSASRFTTATEATAQAGATTITLPTLTGMTYSVAAGATATGNTLGYLSVIDLQAEAEEVPADGTGYTAAANFTGTVVTSNARVVYDGPSVPTAVALTGLASDINYTIRTYAYAWDGTNAETKNYLTTTPSAASKFTLATEPNNMASIGATTNRTATTATLNWTNNGTPGTNSIITMAQSANAAMATVADAVDGTSYTAVPTAHAWNSNLLSGSTYVGYNGVFGTTTINITGLTANKRYDIEGVHYNGTTGTGAENYSAATVTNNFFTLSTEPTAQATTFAAGVTVDATTSLNLSWVASAFTPADGSTVKYLVLAKSGGTAPADLPVDGTNYTVSDNDFSTNAIITTAGEQLVYQGTGTSITVTGLTAATQYSFAIYAYAEGLDATTVNYNTTSAPTVSRYTLKVAPTVNATLGVFSSATNSGATSGVTYTWTAGTGTDYYLVVVSPAAHTADPVDGTDYTADAAYSGTGSVLGNGKVVYNGTGLSVAITGLAAATTYEFTVYGFAQTTSAQTNNYKIDDEFSASTTTLAQPITAEATALNVDNLAVGTYRLNWTAGTGPNTIGYVVVARSGTLAGTTDPVDGTGYTALDTDPDNTTSALGNGEVVYNGSNTTVTLTGLSDATAYTFKVYAYNWNASNISSRNYGTGSTAFSRISLNTVPAVQATASVGTRTTTSLVANYNYPNGTGTPNNTLLTIRPTSDATVTNPTTGVYYDGLTTGTVNATIGATQLSTSSSTVVSSTGFMVTNTYPTAVTINGLTANTQYTISPYSANITDNTLGNSNTDANYNTTVNTVTAYTLQTAPNVATAAVYSSLGTTSYNLAWTAPVGGTTVNGYVVLAKAGASTSTGVGNEPAGGTQYTNPGNLAFGGDAFGANELMYVGTTPNITITGLTANTQYSFAVYTLTDGANAATTTNYSTALSTSRYTLDAEPTFAPVLSSAVKGTTSIQFTAASGGGTADKLIVYALKGSSVPAAPTTTPPSDGTAGSVLAGSSVLTTGTGVLVYDGAFGTVTISSLDNATYYSFIAYAYNDNGVNAESNNYFGTASTALQTNTLATEPTTQSGNPTVTTRTDVSVNFTVTNGDGAASLVSNQLLSNVAVSTPVDGTDYTANTLFGLGSDLGSSVLVKKIGNALTGTVTGLSAATQYTLKSYAYNGTATGLSNFLVTSPGTTTFRTLATAPTSQPGTVTYTAATHNASGPTSGYTISWTAATGATGTTKYLVIGKATSSSNFSPTNGTAYTLNQDLSDGSVYYVGTALTTGALIGLTPNTTYNWRIFAYDDLSFTGSENYFGTAATSNQVTLSADPHVFTTAAALTKTTLTDQSIDLTWTAATATETNTATPTGYLVVAKSGSAVTTTPTDGVNASADNFFSGGTNLGSSEYVVYKSTGTSVSVTGLTSGTTYHFKVFSYTQGTPAYSANFSYNSAVTAPNVNNLIGSFSTLATAPGSGPSAMAVSARTNTSINTTWSSGASAANTLILRKETAFINADEPVNGQTYSASGGVTQVYNAAQKNNESITGLTADTKYFFKVYDYNGTAATTNYGSGTTFTSTSGYTLANQPSSQVVLTTTGSTQNGTSLVIPYTYAGTVGDRIIVLFKTSDITSEPVDGTSYLNAAVISGATVSQTFSAAASGNITVTGLTQNTSYFVAGFSFVGDNYVADANATYNYNPTIGATNGVGSNKIQLSTIASVPATAPTAVLVPNAQRTNNGHRVTWTAGNGTSTLVLASTNSSAPTLVNGVTYAAGNLTYASATDATGFAGYKVMRNGGNVATIDIVLPTTAATRYYYYVYDFNGGSGAENYTVATTGNHHTLETAPTGASNALAAGSTNAGGTIGLTWNTADDVAKTLLVRRNDGSAPTAPTNGQDYPSTVDVNTTVSTTLAAGATDAKTFSVTGLTAGTTYQFNAYAFTGVAVTGTTPSGTSEGTNNYAAGAGVLTVIARSAEPTAQATSIVASAVLDNTATLSWTAAAGGATRYLVVVTTAASLSVAPTDGIKYANGGNYAGPLDETNAFGNLVSTLFHGSSNSSIVYNGTGTTMNLTGLSSNTSYKAVVFAFNEAATVGSENYNPGYSALDAGSSNYISFATLNTEPTTSTSGLSATPAGTSISIAYTAGNGAGRVVFYKTGTSSPTFTPVDGVAYTDGVTYGDGIAKTTTSTPVVLTGLSSATNYAYAFYEYNGSGAARNYKQTSPATGTALTTAAPVLTSLAFTSGNAGSYITTSSNFTIELRDAGNAVFTETAVRTITLSMSFGSSTVTLGTAATVIGQTSVNINSVNVPNLVNSGNGTLVGTLWATTTGVTRAIHGSDNITVVATPPTISVTLNTARASGQITVTTSFGANTGYVLWTKKGSAVSAIESGLTDGTTVTADVSNINDGTERLSYIGTISSQIFTGLTTGTFHFRAVPYKGTATNATVNYGQDLATSSNRFLPKQANYNSEFDENSPNDGGFEISELEQNPATDKVTFNLHSYSNQVFNVEIISNTGEKVATGLLNAGLGRGKHLVRIPLSENIASGTYYITVTSGGEMIAKSFVIVK